VLDFIYYPVSVILWLWHNALAAVLGPSSALSWVLAVVFLVITLRAALVVPFVKQARLQQVMQRLQPRIAAIQKRYPTDRRRQSAEVNKLHREHGVNILLGFLPMLAQTLVFIGLFHVLHSFDRTGAPVNLPFFSTAMPMSAEANAQTPNYAFSAEQVQSFLNTRLFGAPLAASIHTATAHLGAVTAVTVPLMLIAATATHFTARASVARQPHETPNAIVLRVLSLWLFPLGALISGAFLPVGILIYWVTNNAWTVVQQHIVYRALDREAAAVAERTRQRRAARTPRPGRKPSGHTPHRKR
jgi:YidC/Oxa1 family membrane protein insertase